MLALVPAGLAVAAALAWVVEVAGPLRLPDPPASPGPAVTERLLFGRTPETAPVVYPYSVVPGGVHSRAQLLAAVAADPVVATHYEGIKVGEAVRSELPGFRRAHLSYRIGNRVFWTRRKVLLRPREPVLTDGIHLVRAGCGNRIEDRLSGETSDAEPDAHVLDEPLVVAAGSVLPSGGPLSRSGYEKLVFSGVQPNSMGPDAAPEDYPGPLMTGWVAGSPLEPGGEPARTVNDIGHTTEYFGGRGTGDPVNRAPGAPVDFAEPGTPEPPGLPGDPGPPSPPTTPPPLGETPPDPPVPPVVDLPTGETPEPAALVLLALGAGSWLARRARRRNV